MARLLAFCAGSASRNTSKAATGAATSSAFSVAGCSSPKCAEHDLGAEPQRAGAAGVIPGRCVARDLRLGGIEAERGQHREHVGLGVEQVDVLGGAVPMAAAAGRAWRFRRARRRPRCTGRPASRRDRLGRARTAPRRRSRDCGCASAPSSRPGSKLGRIDDISVEIGLASSSAAAPPPNAFASAAGMNDQVIASTRPRAASVRRARRARFWRSVSTARATPAGRGSGVAGTRSRPAMRTTSSTRSAAPCKSGRQDGVVTLMTSPLPRTSQPSDSSIVLISLSGRSSPASFATCPVSKVMP